MMGWRAGLGDGGWGMRGALVGLALLLTVAGAAAQSSAEPAGRPVVAAPVIDVHLHARTADEAWAEVVRSMDEHGVALAVLSVHEPALMARVEADPDRFLAGPAFPCHGGAYPAGGPCFGETDGWPDPEWLREQYETGRMTTMGELFQVYRGIAPDDPRLAPYWALAAELDVPVGVHIGRGPPPQARAPGCCPEFDDDFGDPSLLRPVLERHPDLRVWLMHAGGAFLDETIALMRDHPTVYAEMSVVNSIAPPPAEAAALAAFRAAGLLDRVMLGSDNRPLGPILERLERAPLSDEERAGIRCGNAARFLRLEPGICGGDARVGGPQ